MLTDLPELPARRGRTLRTTGRRSPAGVACGDDARPVPDRPGGPARPRSTQLEAASATGVPLRHPEPVGRPRARGCGGDPRLVEGRRRTRGLSAELPDAATCLQPGLGLWVPTPPGNLRAMQPFWGSQPVHGARLCQPNATRARHPRSRPIEQSPFFAEAAEVFETVEGLTPEQEAIALFWADDPGRTATPPGHSLSILTQLLVSEDSSLADAGGGVRAARHRRVRRVHRLLAHEVRVQPASARSPTSGPTSTRAWGDPLPVTTPPFPEYTSGHSVQSGATAEVLTALFGAVSFTDHTHDALGLRRRARSQSFDEAARGGRHLPPVRRHPLPIGDRARA